MSEPVEDTLKPMPVDPDATFNPSATGSFSAALSHGSLPNMPPLAVPGYEFQDILGAGGMGVVWKAVQTGLNRVCALKMLPGVGHSNTDLIRFLAEAEALAAVKHPNVVQVYEYGDAGGRPFLAMEYLPGGDLSGRLKGGVRLPPTEAASIVAKISRGVQAAHDQQIVHRDMKSANVMFDAAGEPRVTDFGLAKRAASDLTQTQAVMGTPAYMAPEQARGGSKFVGPGADIWALGVILYECLTGTRPFVADDTFGLLRAVAESDPVRPRGLVPELPRDIEEVCMKCLAKDPGDRYHTAGAVAADLMRFVSGESVTARPPNAIERAARWAKRKPTLAAAYALGTVAVGLLALSVGGGVLLWQATTARREADANRKTADDARSRAEQAQKQLDRIGYGRTVDLAHREYQQSDVGHARLLLGQCREEYRGWEWHYVHRLCYADVRTIDAHRGGTTSVVYDRASGRIVTTGEGAAKVWDISTGQLQATIAGNDPVGRAAAFSPDGRRVLTGGRDAAQVWDMSGKLLAKFAGHDEPVLAVAFGPDGTWAVTGGDDSKARVWNTATGAEMTVLSGHTAPVWAVAVAADGRIATAGADNTARVWPAGGGPSLVLAGHTETIIGINFSADGTLLATASRDGTARTWNAKTGAEVRRLVGHTGPVAGVAFDPAGGRLVTAGKDRTVRVWNAATGRELRTFRGHEAQVEGVVFGPDERIVSASLDGTVRLWDIGFAAEYTVLGRHPDKQSIESAQFSPDGTRVATSGNGRKPTIWDATKAETPLVVLLGHKGNVQGVAYSPDGTRIASAGGAERTGKVSDAATGKEQLALPVGDRPASCVRFRPNGKQVAVGSMDGFAYLFDAIDGRLIRTIAAHPGSLVGVRFSPDGTRMATASWDKTAKLWDAETGELIRALTDHTEKVTDVGYNPDGGRLVTASMDRTAKVWDAATGELLLTLSGHSQGVGSAQFSPDGRRIVTGSYDGLTKLWDAETGAELLTLGGHTSRVTDAQFSPDGGRIVTASQDGTALLWDSAPVGRR